jgi:hypothetical protein
MADEYIEAAHNMRARRHRDANLNSPHHTPNNQASPLTTLATASLLRGTSLAGRGGAPVRHAAMQNMQHTHGNRAVQRTQRSGQTPGGALAVQREHTPTDSVAVMEQIMGKESAGLDWIKGQMGMQPGQAMHSLESMRKMGWGQRELDWMAGQMGMAGVADRPKSGPYAYGRENNAGGHEFAFRANGHTDDYVDSDVGFGEGAFGAWEEEGGVQKGFRVKGGLARSKINEGGIVSGDWEAGTAGAEFSYGDNGFRWQTGATGVGGGMTFGNFEKDNPTDTQVRVGLSAGPSLGFRGHWGDSDGDGIPEIGGGVDIGPLSIDSKSERAIEMNRKAAEMVWDVQNAAVQETMDVADFYAPGAIDALSNYELDTEAVGGIANSIIPGLGGLL